MRLSRFALGCMAALLAFAPDAVADNLAPGIVSVQTTAGAAVNLNLPPGFFGHGSVTSPLSLDGLALSPQPSGSASNLDLGAFTSNFMGGTMNHQPATPGLADIVLQHGGGTLPAPGGTLTVPIEIIALSLTSSFPITVTTYGVDSFYDVFVTLAPVTQPVGTLTLAPTTMSGGLFTAQIPVLVELLFVQVGGGTNPNYPPPVAWQPGQLTFTASGSYTVVPEPGTMALMGMGVAGIVTRFRRRR